ncbi:MAG TPA: nucleotidyltransferase family protein [Myxococcota bacterium]
MDHRASARAVRALAGGSDAFVSALERTPDYDADCFERFVTHHQLRAWVAPALTSVRAERLIGAGFRDRLREYRAARIVRNHELLRDSVEVRSALSEAGLGCLFLKGLYVGQRFYGDANLRHQGDVDVLVRSRQLEAALAALARVGYDVETNLDDGKPVAARLREIRGWAPAKAPHAITVRRGATRLDLHWCLNSRSFGRVEEQALWTGRRRFQLAGHDFETLSDEDMLAFLLVSLCEDLRRGAGRAKHFLDLYLILRALDARIDWERFCERQRAQGVLKPSINVLATFFALWGCAAEFPGVARALERRLRLVELRDAEEALALIERPRGSAENRVWFRRVFPRSSSRYWAWRLTRDLPHTLTRLQGSREFVLPEG